jgi:cytochrome oxidase Cu insertion factor (SCO1/SenC/PrrC family)
MRQAAHIVLAALLALAPVALGNSALASTQTQAPDFNSMQVQTYAPPKPAPALSLPDLQGKTVHLSDLKGKVVLVFFWATW